MDGGLGMYTEGVRKILTPRLAKNTHEAAIMADDCGYDCFSFNGDVYVKTECKSKWVKTPFRVIDFKVCT